jgi:hypothetical protein
MDPKGARDVVLARLGDVGRLKRTCVHLGRKRSARCGSRSGLTNSCTM